MDHIIRGIRYNIAASTLLAKYGNGFPEGHPMHLTERLYVSDELHFFKTTARHALPISPLPPTHPTPPSFLLSALSDDQALAWMEKHEDEKLLRHYFPPGDPEDSSHSG